MKKYLSIPFLAILLIVCLSACDRNKPFEPEAEEIAPPALLTAGEWNLDSVVGFANDAGVLLRETVEPYGIGTANGPCSFTFAENNYCIMVDDDSENETEYSYHADNTMVIDGMEYRVDALTDHVLLITMIERDKDAEIVYEENMCFTR